MNTQLNSVSFDQLTHEALRTPQELMLRLLKDYPASIGEGVRFNPVPSEVRRIEPCHGVMALYVRYHSSVDVSLRFLSRQLQVSNLRGWDLFDAAIDYRHSTMAGQRFHKLLLSNGQLRELTESGQIDFPVVDYTPHGVVQVLRDIRGSGCKVYCTLKVSPDTAYEDDERIKVVENFYFHNVSQYIAAQYAAKSYLEQYPQWDQLHTDRDAFFPAKGR